MRSSTGLLAIWTMSALILAAPALAGNRTLARVDGQPLTVEDLQEIFASQHMGHTSFLAGQGEVRKALDTLIERTLLLHEAERMDLGSRPEIQAGVDGRVDRLSVQHLMKVEIEEPAQPSQEEIRAAYEQFTGHLLQVRQIVVVERDEAEEIAALLAAGEPFAELARQRSRVKSRQADGLLPPIPWGIMEAAWDQVAFGLEPGEISDPFVSAGAWEIVLLEERLPVELPALSQAGKKIQGILLQRGLDERERDLSARVFKKHAADVKLTPFTTEIYRAALGRDPETVVAVWEGGELRIRELLEDRDLDTLEERAAEQATRDLEEQVRVTVTRPLLVLEARARKYDKRPEIQAEAEAFRDKAMLAVLHDEFIFKDLTVTDADVRSWYDSHTDEIRTPEKRFVSQILVQTEAEVRAARQRLTDGIPFADLAREISIDTASAPKGGALGWISLKESPAGFDVVFSLPQGESSEPLQSDLGWHLVRVLEVQPAAVLPFEEAEVRIRKQLVKEKREEKRQEWLTQLRAAATIKIDSDAVRAFAAENAPPAQSSQ